MKTAGALKGVMLSCVLALPVACATSNEDSDQAGQDLAAAPAVEAMDVNDISFLFPVVDGKPVPEISMDLKGTKASANLLPASVLADLAAFNNTQNVTTFAGMSGDRANWRVVSFRFDPCRDQASAADVSNHFPVFALKNLDSNLASCDIEIRLVAQPFVDGKAVDTAAGIAFSFGVGNKDARDRILHELAVLKSQSPVATAGVPLGPHPGLTKDTSGTFAAAVKEFLATELAQAQIGLIGSLGTQNGDPWVFAVGTADATQHWTVGPIKGFGVAAQGETEVRAQQSIHGSVSFPQANVGEHNFVAAVAPLFGDDTPADTLDVAQKITNPAMVTRFNTDCISCHSVTERIVDKQIPASASRFVVPKGVTAYVEQQNTNHGLPMAEGGPQGKFNFRAFGYFDAQPTVSYRTVNETAMLLARINQDLLHKDVGPGPVCDDEKVWTCFRDGKTAADCLSPANGCVSPK